MSSPRSKISVQRVLAGDLGEDPQLDLVVVGREQAVAARRDEAGADRPALLGADRDVLQVRVGAGEPAGRGRGLVEGRVDAAGLGVDQLRQRVEVGALQLGQLAPGLDLGDDLVLVADLGEDAGVGREAGLAAALLGQAELVEEDLGELLRRADRELARRPARRSPPGARRSARSKPSPMSASRFGVELHPDPLHLGQHLDQRHLDLVHQLLEAVLLHRPRAGARRAPRPGGPRRRGRRRGSSSPSSSWPSSALPSARRRLGLRGRREAALGGDLDQVVGAPRRVEQVGADHRVVAELERAPRRRRRAGRGGRRRRGT